MPPSISSSDTEDVPMEDAVENLSTADPIDAKDKDEEMQNGTEEEKVNGDITEEQKSPAESKEENLPEPTIRTLPSSSSSFPPINSPSVSHVTDRDKPQEKAVFEKASTHKRNSSLNGVNATSMAYLSPSATTSVLPSVEGTDDTETSAEALRLARDTERLRQTVTEVGARPVHTVMREQWRLFLFDSVDESHITFVLRAGLKNATADVLQRVFKDDSVSKAPFIETVSRKPALRAKVLQTTSVDELLQTVSSDVIDALLVGVVGRIPAQNLVNILARAKRLGYEEDDIVISGVKDLVIPNVPPNRVQHPPPPPQHRNGYPSTHGPPQGPVHGFPHPEQYRHPGPPPLARPPGSNLATPGVDPLLAEQNRQKQLAEMRENNKRDGVLSCNDCGHVFSSFPGYHHHITKKPCAKQPPIEGYKAICQNCRVGFTTKQGHDYHLMKGVCLGNEPTPPQPPPGYMVAVVAPPLNDGLPGQQPLRYPMPNPQVQAPPIPRPSDTIPPPNAPWASQPPQRPFPPGAQLPSSQPPTPAQQSSFTPRNVSTPDSSRSKVQVAIPSPDTKKGTKATQFSNSTAPPVTRKQATRSEVRLDPSELPADRLAELNRELAEVDRRYELGLTEIPADFTQEQKQTKMLGLKNAASSRKSQIRKAYGVTLRMRDTDKRAKSDRQSLNKEASPSVSAGTSPAPGPSGNSIPRPKYDAMRSTSAASPLASQVTSGFSPVNAPQTRVVPTGPPPPYNQPSSAIPTTSQSPMSISANSGFAAPRLNGNTTNPQRPAEPNTSNTESAANSGTSTPSSIPSKRRHSEAEHERRPESGQGYAGGVPTRGAWATANSQESRSARENAAVATSRFDGSDRQRARFGTDVNGSAESGSGRGSEREVIDLDDESDDDDDDDSSIPAVVEKNLRSTPKGKGKAKSGEDDA